MVLQDEDEFQKYVPNLKEAFYSRKGFYPSLSNFLNKLRDDFTDKNKFNAFVRDFRPLIEKFYKSQEIVQVFGPPVLKESLKRKAGYYPKIISFYPFERLYCDQGIIRIYNKTRSQEAKEKKQKEKTVKPIVAPKAGVVAKPISPKDDATEYKGYFTGPSQKTLEALKKYVDREERFSGTNYKDGLRGFSIKNTGLSWNPTTKAANQEFFKKRAKYVLDNKEKFTDQEIKKAETGLFYY